MSEIELPSHWKIIKFDEVCQFTSKPRNLKYTNYEKIPFIPMDLIPIGNLCFDKFVWKLSSQISSGTYFENGDFLLAKITPSFENGKQGIIKNLPLDFGVATTEVIPIKGIPSLSDREFLAYYLLRQDIRNELAQKMEGSTGRQRLSKTILEKLEIPLPPLPEQKSIAHTLRTIQKAKQTRQRELELERERKAALMQYLFTHGTQSYNNKAELQNTKIGYIPKHWYIEQCKNICEKISVGVVVKPASHYVEKGVPAFRSLNIKEDRISTDKLVFFSEEANNNTLSKSKLRTGDVLIVRTGYPGTSCVVPPEFEGANCIDLVFARPKTEVITSEYLSRYFNSSEGKRQALAAKTGLAQQHLNVNAVQRCLIPIPSLQEQNQITDVLIACDRKISSLEKEIAILDELFHAMLEQLMTGKISTKHLSEIHL